LFPQIIQKVKTSESGGSSRWVNLQVVGVEGGR